MTVYENIIQGLTEAIDYQEGNLRPKGSVEVQDGKIKARKTKLTIKPVATFNNSEIKKYGKKPD